MTLEELQSDLSASLAWRKLELQQARDLAEGASENSTPYLCRAWTLVMYAHCDQYLKEVSRLYLCFLRDNPRQSYDYISIWQAFRSKEIMLKANDGERYQNARRPTKISTADLIDVIAHESVIDSGSFSYKRLRFIVDFVLQVDLDCINYKAFCTTLKIKRDEIAHGEKSFIQDVSDCIAWHEPTLQLLDQFRDSVLSTAAA